MIEWFKNLNDAEKIAIVVPVIVAVIGGLLGLLKAFGKGKGSSTQKKTFQQKGSDNVAANIDGSGNTTNVAGRDVNLGIDGDAALNQLVSVSKEAGQSKNEIEHLKDTISKLEGQLQLVQQQVLTGAGGQQTPQPTQEAKELAKLITKNDGPYAQALKAIAEGNNKKADGLLDETQQFLDRVLDQVQQRKNETQAKIYRARMQNATYPGKLRDALQWCDRLKPLAGEDTQILNEIATVYYDNANYNGAEPLMKRVVEILENPGGEPLPNYAVALNNLAQLYQATNRLSEAEGLMKRAMAIDEASFGKDHPNVATDLNNLAQLYQATNRLADAEPLMKRAMAIDEASFGKDHPDVARDLNNLVLCQV